jgi:hypothetical protein
MGAKALVSSRVVARVTSSRVLRFLLAGASAWPMLGACGTNEAAPPALGAGGMSPSAGAAGSSTSGRSSGAAGSAAAGRSSGAAGSAAAGRSSGAAGSPAAGRASAEAGGGAGGGAAGESATGTDLGCLHDGDGKTTLAFVNGCSSTVTYEGSDIDSGTLSPGSVECVDIGTDVEELSAKRYWGFTGEDPGAEHHSLAEFTFNTDFYDFDWYNISYVDAFNLPLAIAPASRPDCDQLRCADDFLAGCPSEGKLELDGAVVACVSPERNDGESPVALFFEQCDDAYAWSGDDQAGDDPSPVRACAGEDWVITFCPD